MKVTNLVGIVVACALAGCVAQAGTEDPSGSTQQGLSVTATAGQQQQTQQDQQTLALKAKLEQAFQVQTHPTPAQPIGNLQGLAGTDPGAPVQDDGDGKEPDPHPWHMSTAVTAAH